MTLSEQFEEIGKTLSNVREDLSKIKVKDVRTNSNIEPEKPTEPKREFFYDKSTDKARRILFWTLLIVVGGLALALIVRSVIFKIIR